MSNKGCAGSLAGMIVIVAIIISIFGGWVANIVKLTKCDFKAPYKSEIIRIISIPVFPAAVIVGWLELDDTPPTNSVSNVSTNSL